MRFSEVYLTLCIELEKILREWWRKRGPQIGDWCTPKDPVEPGHGLAFLIGSKSRRFYHLYSSEGTQRWGLLAEHLIEAFIPLPSQRQLEEMLEERGYKWSEMKSEDGRYHYAGNDIDLNFTIGHGPDPETALLGALAEVLKRG